MVIQEILELIKGHLIDNGYEGDQRQIEMVASSLAWEGFDDVDKATNEDIIGKIADMQEDLIWKEGET